MGLRVRYDHIGWFSGMVTVLAHRVSSMSMGAYFIIILYNLKRTTKIHFVCDV